MLLRLLRGEMSPRWFDDAATGEEEDRRQILSRELAAAWREGRERWGGEVAGWDYGLLHALTLRHRLDRLPFFGRWARRGPYATPGSGTTVAAFSARSDEDPRRVTDGPSMRWIVDLGGGDQAFAALPGGQSGHPGDRHYDDRIGPYLAGELQPAAWSEAAIAAAAVSTMRLVP
jgi:penicillin amidase